MAAQDHSARKQSLKRNLEKSLGKVRLSKRARTSLADKNKIKKVAVDTLQRYLKNELKRTRTKTYDWYFFKDYGEVYHIEAFRNILGKNRYFIVDHKQMPILSANAFGSTYGQQHIQEFDITSKQIGEIISSSKKLFADMMKITVSEKEDEKIYKAYDTVDEKKIIVVTIGLPAALIASAEAVPLMVMASKSATFSSMTSSVARGFALNSGRSALLNGTSNFAEQYMSNGMAKNRWGAQNFKRIDMFDVGMSAGTSGFGGVFLKSKFDYTYEHGFKTNKMPEFSKNMALNSLKFGTSKAFGNSIGKSLKEFGGPAGEAFGNGGQFTIKTVISTGKKKKFE